MNGLIISYIIVILVIVIISIVLIISHDRVWEGGALIISSLAMCLLQLCIHKNYSSCKTAVGTSEVSLSQEYKDAKEKYSEYIKKKEADEEAETEELLRRTDEMTSKYKELKKKKAEEDAAEDMETEELLRKTDEILNNNRNNGIEITDTEKLLKKANDLIKFYKMDAANSKELISAKQENIATS